jgi:hypothetical protein
MHLFILLLKSGKFFIGSFMNSNEIFLDKLFIRNLTNNFNWISADLPIKIIDIIEIQNVLDIDIKTKEYMIKHGIDNVRGGSYSNHQLEEYQEKTLNDELSEFISQRREEIVFSFDSIEKHFENLSFEEKLSAIATDYLYGSKIMQFINGIPNSINLHQYRGRCSDRVHNYNCNDKYESENKQVCDINFLINDDYNIFVKKINNIYSIVNANEIISNLIHRGSGWSDIASHKEQVFLSNGPPSDSKIKYMFNRIQQTAKQIIDRYGSIDNITKYYDYLLNNFTEDRENKFNLDGINV